MAEGNEDRAEGLWKTIDIVQYFNSSYVCSNYIRLLRYIRRTDVTFQ